ncbi:MAG: hypothetical protein NTY19_03980 [Planctomycetota bacterium]|nr:hypothetical protein [Planctomycetota bacterium]
MTTRDSHDLELALAEYERDKLRLKNVLLELSRLASQAIVHEPESERHG